MKKKVKNMLLKKIKARLSKIKKKKVISFVKWNENLKNWQLRVSPGEWKNEKLAIRGKSRWKKWKFEELAIRGKSKYVNENWGTSRQGQVHTKKKKTYLIGHLDCKTNQVGTQVEGDD